MNKAKQGRKRNLCALSVGVLIAAATLACSSEESAKIGDPVSVDKSAPAGYVGSWEGYVEAFTFMSGSDHLRLSLDAEGKGWLQVGDRADLLPAPTDSDVAWPPLYASFDPTTILSPNRLLDGVRYPIVGAKVEGARLRFSIDPFDAFVAWCPLQTPVFVDSVPSTYSCGYGGFSITADGTCVVGEPSNSRPINCGKAMLCTHGVCECDANACKAGTSRHAVTVDATLADEAGSRLDGSILMPGESDEGPNPKGGPYTIHLKR